MAVLGAENKAGDFEVVEICFPGLAPQPALPPLPPLPLSTPSTSTSKDVDMNGETEDEGEWIALLSGLEMGGGSDAADLRIQLMAEWLIGELGDEDVSSPPLLFLRPSLCRLVPPLLPSLLFAHSFNCCVRELC